jgi:hypothetical protein
VDGRTLPFVVIADSEGKQLVGRSGYGEPADFQQLIKEASRQIAKDNSVRPAAGALKPLGGQTAVSGKAAAGDTNIVSRTWKSKSGMAVKASLVEVSGGYVVLKKTDGSTVKLASNNLSPEDQQYLAALKEKGADARK